MFETDWTTSVSCWSIISPDWEIHYSYMWILLRMLETSVQPATTSDGCSLEHNMQQIAQEDDLHESYFNRPGHGFDDFELRNPSPPTKRRRLEATTPEPQSNQHWATLLFVFVWFPKFYHKSCTMQSCPYHQLRKIWTRALRPLVLQMRTVRNLIGGMLNLLVFTTIAFQEQLHPLVGKF